MAKFNLMASVGLIGLTFATIAAGQTQTTTRIAAPDTSLRYATTYLANDLGIFKASGVLADIADAADGNSMAALLSDKADWALTSGRAFAKTANGNRVVAIANLVERPLAEVILKKSIADQLRYDSRASAEVRGKLLKGRNIAIDARGSEAHAWLINTSRRSGLDPDKDLKISIMPIANMAAALQSGAIDGFSAPFEATAAATRSGAGVALASSLGADAQGVAPFAASLLVTRAETCQKSKALCESVMKAYVEASRILRDEALRSTLTLKKRFSALGDDAFTGSLDAIRRASLRSSPRAKQPWSIPKAITRRQASSSLTRS